jgi:hypothetical protein
MDNKIDALLNEQFSKAELTHRNMNSVELLLEGKDGVVLTEEDARVCTNE